MAKAHLKLVTPATVKRTVTSRRLPNAKLRTREYLTEDEVEGLMEAAKTNHYGHRDATMVLVAYRHGLRAAELVDLRCGIRWTSKRRPSMSAESRKARPAHTQSSGTSCVPCGGFSASRSLSRPFSSRRSEEPHSPPPGSPGWSNALAPGASLDLRRTRTCYGTPADMLWPTRGTTQGLCKPTSVTKISSTRCVTPNYRRLGSRISGATICPRNVQLSQRSSG
jgi:hypothetical protein